MLEVVLFTTNLEHIGDIIDKGLLRLAAKKQKQGLRFSDDGWRDIRAFHALIAEQMRRALAVFVSPRRGRWRATSSPRRTGCATRSSRASRAALPPAARRAAGDDRDQRAASRRAARPEADQRPPDHGRLSDPGADRRAARLAAARARSPSAGAAQGAAKAQAARASSAG